MQAGGQILWKKDKPIIGKEQTTDFTIELNRGTHQFDTAIVNPIHVLRIYEKERWQTVFLAQSNIYSSTSEVWAVALYCSNAATSWLAVAPLQKR